MSITKHLGYLEVKFYNAGKCKSPTVHTLLAKAFLYNPCPTAKRYTVDHINQDAYDNLLINLRWATKRQQQLNRTHAYKNKDQPDVPQDLEWRAIPADLVQDAEGYEIAHKGAWLRYVGTRDGMRRDVRTPSLNKTTGYTWHTVGNERYRAHILVAAVFLGPPPAPGLVVDHIDENKSNNDVSNLRYATPSENGKHSKIVRKEVQCRLAEDGPVIKTFISITEAAKLTGSFRSRIIACYATGKGSTKSKVDGVKYFWNASRIEET
jgi:HNH endonuclease